MVLKWATTNIELKLHIIKKKKTRNILTIFVDFEGFYAIHPILPEYLHQNASRWETLGPSGSFDTPGDS